MGKFKKGENHPRWRGGRFINSKGYVMILKPDHPRAVQGYVKEHILVLEKKLGRPLRSEEVPHHRNRVKTDNRPENLDVLVQEIHGKLHQRFRKRRFTITYGKKSVLSITTA